MDKAFNRGFGIIGALFLVVAIGALGAAISVVSQGQQKTAALDVMASQAYHAARSGIQFGIYRALTTRACDLPTDLTPTQWNGRFRIRVTCTITVGPVVKTYRIESLVCNATSCDETTGGAANYIERKMSVTAEGPR